MSLLFLSSCLLGGLLHKSEQCIAYTLETEIYTFLICKSKGSVWQKKSQWSILSIFYNFILFIYFWLHWVFVAAYRLSLVAECRGYSLLRCTGFSLWWLLLLWSTGSRHAGFSSCGLRAPERSLSSCGSRAKLICGMWRLPGPGLEPVSPALAGGFLTNAPSGKPYIVS